MKIRLKAQPKDVVVPFDSAPPLPAYVPSTYGVGSYGMKLYSQGAGKPIAGSGWVKSQLCPDPSWAPSALCSFDVVMPAKIHPSMDFRNFRKAA